MSIDLLDASPAPAGIDAQLQAHTGFIADLRAGPGAPPAPVLTWAQLQARIVQLNTAAHQIATVWHPDAVGELVETSVGNVRALQGDARYQFTTGEVVEL